ncbi:hypothetical protein UFOVP112_371 [uncultured Caudovirales phage]|uniref:Uncharacterized protein n=1 Tax=uncultured Caudovirales phage TaxID=2100421 RepID=A0A6J5L7F9_9CAUD|nr:hypothetical protein UFOVP112_371 [uncultured Caudovirales phage]
MSLDRDLEEDIWQSKEILNKIKTRKDYAQNVYAALCNMRWQPLDVIPILKDEYWTCSWRSAGGIVADFRKTVATEDYMDWYCSGMGGLATYDEQEGEEYMTRQKYVPEGAVTDEIRKDFATLGWAPSPWPKD